MASPVLAFAELTTLCEKDGWTPEITQRIGSELAKTFKVREDEVAILRLENSNLHFVYPIKLQHVGTIPLNNTSSVAAHIANSKRPEVTNNFAQTKHASIFEAVELGEKHQHIPGEKHVASIIHKLMSAPVMAKGAVVGVIQVCRKGESAPASGPDFSAADLQKLITVTSQLAKCFK